MDGPHFDVVTRELSAASRRGILATLGTAVLAALYGHDGSEVGARRHRHHRRRQGAAVGAARHKPKNKKKRKHPAAPPASQGCTPESAAQTCAGRCGTVPNTCGTPVDCGSCACSLACPVCQTCNGTTGRCETNPAFLGLVCAAPGQVCQANGACVCDSGSCPTGQRCNGLACVCDGTSCPTGCCDRAGSCHIGDDAACGTGGGACTRCTGTGVTCGGGGTAGTCGCTSQGCGSQSCGTTVDNCGQTIPCGGCTGCCDGITCRTGADRETCGTGGNVCQACAGVCGAGNVCTSCSPANPRTCPAGMCCAGGVCVARCPDCQVCNSVGHCVTDPGQNRTPCQVATGGTGVCCSGSCCAGCCDGEEACGPCLAFVTSTQYSGNLGGLVGADRKCQARAEAANLPGTYKAWLSNGTHSPATRFRCTGATCSSQGYQCVDGVTLANDWADLTDGILDAALSKDELGETTFVGVWTHTLPNGTPGGPGNGHCQNWTVDTAGDGDLGDPSATAALWTTWTEVVCANGQSLYCFQQS